MAESMIPLLCQTLPLSEAAGVFFNLLNSSVVFESSILVLAAALQHIGGKRLTVYFSVEPHTETNKDTSSCTELFSFSVRNVYLNIVFFCLIITITPHSSGQ